LIHVARQAPPRATTFNETSTEEAKAAVPQSGNPSTSTSPAIPEEFGANEWLVEEMHDRYQQDPSSVDPTWAAY
jgi:2-oxoglutarate dehydrogenase E1 component